MDENNEKGQKQNKQDVLDSVKRNLSDEKYIETILMSTNPNFYTWNVFRLRCRSDADLNKKRGDPGIEPEPRASEARILPLN
jgi:hypothetical protein